MYNNDWNSLPKGNKTEILIKKTQSWNHYLKFGGYPAIIDKELTPHNTAIFQNRLGREY